MTGRIFARVVLISVLSGLCCSLAMAGAGDGPEIGSTLAVLPFVALLAAMAVLPFVNSAWWKRYYPVIALALGGAALLYEFIVADGGSEVLETGMEYLSFIILIGSLYVVSGGILIRLRGKSSPAANVGMLAAGAVAANLIGTTGASLILIRPYLRVNRYRLRAFHVVFFIFLVSNVGGALTPIGDPPLFLGFLRGIPFFWVLENLWTVWLFEIVFLLAVFAILDFGSLRRFEAGPDAIPRSEIHETAGFSGLHNLFFLGVILASSFLEEPRFARELLMLGAAIGSYATTSAKVHEENGFSIGPLKEVGILFAGIFAAMIPAVDWLRLHSQLLGEGHLGVYFWGTGVASSFLDNAPTYLNFLAAAVAGLVPQNAVEMIRQSIASGGVLMGGKEISAAVELLLRQNSGLVGSGGTPAARIETAYLIANHPAVVRAISAGAVFFGACTYIGNGPNFVVRSLAEESGVRMPSFIGYVVRFTLPILLPSFVVVWYLFFRS